MAALEIRRNKTAISYRVVWREAGRKQQETFADQAAAEKFLKLVEGHGNRWPTGWTKGLGFATPAVPSVPTFSEWARRAVQSRSMANERTRADYLRDIRLHLDPVFGSMRLDEITREDVGRWLINISRTKSAKTIKNVHGLASSIMADAITTGRYPVSRNEFRGAAAKLADVRTEEMVFLTRQEFDSVLTSTAEHYQPFVLFQYLTGLRWSEATALTVADVQILGRRTVTVNKAWKRQPDNTFSLGPPKSRRSRRTISLPAEAVDALVPLVSGRGGTERLFTSARGYTMHHGNFRYQIWLPALKKAQAESRLEKRPRIHDLRHSHASTLIDQGVDLVAVQRRLGHESIQTTIDRYGHLLPESDERINAALERARGIAPATLEMAPEPVRP